MSGHSKWSKVKHQKAVTDVTKGKFFTKAARAIGVAVEEGGGVIDPEMNFKLRLAIEKARSVNMPKENIDRAIKRARGEGDGGVETIVYEGFGPGGAAILIEAATDNRQRTASAIRNALESAGGSMGSTGSAAYLFEGYRPKFIMALSDTDTKKFTVLIEKLKGLDDVQGVFANV